MDMGDRQSRAKTNITIQYIYRIFAIWAVYWGPIHRRLGGGRSANYTEAQGLDFDHVRRSRLFVSASFTRGPSPLSFPLIVPSLAHHECLQGAVSKNL